MPDSLSAHEFGGQLLNVARLSAQEHHLKAGIVIEMAMERRDDHFMMFMLKVGQFFREEPSVMVIDQPHGSHDRSLRYHNRRSHTSIPDRIAAMQPAPTHAARNSASPHH